MSGPEFIVRICYDWQPKRKSRYSRKTNDVVIVQIRAFSSRSHSRSYYTWGIQWRRNEVNVLSIFIAATYFMLSSFISCWLDFLLLPLPFAIFRNLITHTHQRVARTQCASLEESETECQQLMELNGGCAAWDMILAVDKSIFIWRVLPYAASETQNTNVTNHHHRRQRCRDNNEKIHN